ncbi:MAG: hypothetical protein LH614_17840 [Pyrinomonadaceae bacterium]|nr:hypothetical protein [Pyrinomonadaceae bacterium]
MFFVFAIISFSIAYRRAKATGRSGYLWGIIATATFIGTGLSLTFGFSVFLGMGIELGWSENTLETYTIICAITSMVASFGTTWLILHKLNETSEETLSEPPPPPTFNQN